SAQVLTLTEGVLKAMFQSNLRLAATMLLALGLATGIAIAGYAVVKGPREQTNTPDAPQANELPLADAARQPDAATDHQKKLQPLMEKRLAAVKEQRVARAEELAVGRTSVDVLLESSRNLLKAQQEMSDKPVDRLKMLETHFQRMKVVQKMLERRLQA